MVSGLAMNFVNAGPRWFLTRRGLGSGKRNFHIETVQRATQGDATLCCRGMTMETMTARGDDRILKLQNHFVA